MSKKCKYGDGSGEGYCICGDGYGDGYGISFFYTGIGSWRRGGYRYGNGYNIKCGDGRGKIKGEVLPYFGSIYYDENTSIQRILIFTED